MRIGFIGTGHIAAPMARFLAREGHEIAVTRRNEAVSAALAEEVGADVRDPQEVIDTAEVVVLCLRPHHAADVLAPLAFHAGQKVVSVMAGVSTAELVRLCAPVEADDIVQTIPLGFLEHGDCPLAAFGDTALLADLFAPENPIVPVASEDALNAHFAICAMVPGLLDLMATGAGWLAQETGDPDSAAFYTTQLVSGFLSTIYEEHAGRLEAERDALATQGSLSLQMTTALREGRAHEILREALAAIGKRLKDDTND